jgi:hypothetical protein
MESLHGPHSRVSTLAIAPDQTTRHYTCDISKQRARTHALPHTRSCTGLRRGSAPTPRSVSPPTPTMSDHLHATRLLVLPHLPTAELEEPPPARRGWPLLERIESVMVPRYSRLLR